MDLLRIGGNSDFGKEATLLSVLDIRAATPDILQMKVDEVDVVVMFIWRHQTKMVQD